MKRVKAGRRFDGIYCLSEITLGSAISTEGERTLRSYSDNTITRSREDRLDRLLPRPERQGKIAERPEIRVQDQGGAGVQRYGHGVSSILPVLVAGLSGSGAPVYPVAGASPAVP